MGSLTARLARVDYKYLVAAAFIFGLFMDILDTTIVNVALPKLAEDFHASTADLEWVVTGYLLSLAIWIPASGWIGDRFGTKRTFLFATATFVTGSALCGTAWNITSLALFRVLQGVGGGMMTPVGTAMLYRAFTVQERARASAILSVPTMFAPMLGPVFGGFLVDSLSWRWIFYVNLPVGIASFIFSWMVLKEHTEPDTGRFDPAGFLLSGLGLAGILYSLSEGAEAGWSSPVVMITGIGGLLCFGTLIWVERRSMAPILDLGLYGIRLFRTSNLTAFGFFAAQFGLVFLLPLYLQEIRGLSALESGLTTFPQPIGQLIMVQFTSRLYLKLGPRRMLVIGTAGVAITTGLMMFTYMDTSLWWLRALMFLRGCAVAFNMVSMQTTAFSSVSRARMGRASSLFSTLRQVAAAFGVALAGTMLTSQFHTLAPAAQGLADPAASQAGIQAFHDAVAVVLGLGILATIFAFQVDDKLPSPEPRAAVAPAAGPAAVPVGAGQQH